MIAFHLLPDGLRTTGAWLIRLGYEMREKKDNARALIS